MSVTRLSPSVALAVLLAALVAAPAGCARPSGPSPTRVVIYDHGQATAVEPGSREFAAIGSQAAALVQHARDEIAALALPWEAAARCTQEQVALEVVFREPGVQAGVHGAYTSALIPLDEAHEPGRVLVYLGRERYELLVPAEADEQLAALCTLAGMPVPGVRTGPLPATVAPASAVTPAATSAPLADPELPSRRTLPTPTPDLGDLTPPPGGWIAYHTPDPDNRLALVSPDGARRVALDALGPVWAYAWSPDGRWLAVYRTKWVDRREWLSLISIEEAHIVDVTDRAWGLTPYSWSRDGRTLAYIQRRIVETTGASEYTLDLYDVATGQTTTTIVQPLALAGWTLPAGRPAPPLVPLFRGVEGTLLVWDAPAGRVVASLPDASTGPGGWGDGSLALWLPDGGGLVFARRETGLAPVEVPVPTPCDTCTLSYYPTSLALWRLGEQAAQTVLEAQGRRRYWPEGWLPDGRLEVRVMEWSQDRYECTELPDPERVSYRYFKVGEDGGLEEVGAEGVPWWAGGGLQARLGWPLDPEGEFFRREVGPDGVTVVFARGCPGQENSVCLYKWQGEGEPLALGPGYDPQWQPSASPQALSDAESR